MKKKINDHIISTIITIIATTIPIEIYNILEKADFNITKTVLITIGTAIVRIILKELPIILKLILKKKT